MAQCLEEWVKYVFGCFTENVPTFKIFSNMKGKQLHDYQFFMKDASGFIEFVELNPVVKPWFVGRIEYSNNFVNIFLSKQFLTLNMQAIIKKLPMLYTMSYREAKSAIGIP